MESAWQTKLTRLRYRLGATGKVGDSGEPAEDARHRTWSEDGGKSGRGEIDTRNERADPVTNAVEIRSRFKVGQSRR
jgi:hypothetical protein